MQQAIMDELENLMKQGETPEETQWPEENREAHRGQARWGRRRIQTHRDREREAGGDAGESQSTKGNFESGLRGDQDSPRGPVAKGRID